MERAYDRFKRKGTTFNYVHDNRSRNNSAPEILINQLWIQEEDTTGIKIIELNSSSDSDEPIATNFNHAWSYANNDAYQILDREDNRINEEARRRRRMKMDALEYNIARQRINQQDFNRNIESNTNPFYNTYDSGDSVPLHHQINCFTILNNQNNSNSSSDSENYEAVEIVKVEQSEENKYWNHVYNEEVVSNRHENHKNMQSEKHMIWIYSYKNKRLLSDNDFELVNIPSKDVSSTSTSYSISDEEQIAEKNISACRVASPIPATYIPRLDLSLVKTLSTVTEVSELNKSNSKESSQEAINFKLKNNWFCDRNEKLKFNENTNVVNWLALSPRERRRRSINTNSDSSKETCIIETELTHAEGGVNQLDETSITSSKGKPSTLQVKADIHISDKEASEELYTNISNEATEQNKTKTPILPIKISFTDIEHENNGDIDYFNKPCIQINSKLSKIEITDPIEKLNCNNWISEERVEKETSVYDYELEKAVEVNEEVSSAENVCDSASKRLWLKNIQLMKPPEWTEYMPIACSPLSVHLSISLSSINSKKSWFRRLATCIRCCK